MLPGSETRIWIEGTQFLRKISLQSFLLELKIAYDREFLLQKGSPQRLRQVSIHWYLFSIWQHAVFSLETRESSLSLTAIISSLGGPPSSLTSSSCLIQQSSCISMGYQVVLVTWKRLSSILTLLKHHCFAKISEWWDLKFHIWIFQMLIGAKAPQHQNSLSAPPAFAVFSS